MKTKLTTEESQHLIDLGVPKEKASRSISEGGDADVLRVDGGYITKRGTIYPIFTLADLLEILPKEIIDEEHKIYNLNMECITGTCGVNDSLWIVSYDRKRHSIDWFSAEELIDALYQLACWYYGEYLIPPNSGELKSEEK